MQPGQAEIERRSRYCKAGPFNRRDEAGDPIRGQRRSVSLSGERDGRTTGREVNVCRVNAVNARDRPLRPVDARCTMQAING